MAESGMIMVAAFVMAASLVLLLSTLVGGRRSRLDARLNDLSGKGGPEEADDDPVAQFAKAALPKMGATLIPDDEEKRTKLRARLIHAGLYGRQAMPVFLGVKLLLMVGPTLLGVAASSLGLVPFAHGLIFGALLGGLGLIGPSFWLDHMKSKRQTAFRRALPDALDVLVICLEGGLSLAGAFRRVAGDLRTAHPLLAVEMEIVQREIQMGRSTGEALRQFAERTDLEEIRSLAGVMIQAERFGASMAKALRVHADTLRIKRQHRAEELAMKAAVKMLFPTLFFIFPAIFIVVLGPAVIHLAEIFSNLGK
jgi:tight adherence protein C